MSLVRIALRIAAVQALRGRTYVGVNVLDSRLGALDVGSDGALRTDQDQPFVTVYTDAARAESGDDATQGSQLDLRALRVNGATEIIFEAGITSAMVDTDPVTKESVIAVGTPATDEGFEFQLDMVARQIGDVLTDPDNEWSEIFRCLIRRFVRVDRSRAGTAEGQRMAAHQIRITAELVADPVKGEALKQSSSMAKFFAMAEQVDDEDVQTQIAAMKAAIAGGAYDWETPLRRYGLTRDEAEALLITAASGAENDIAVAAVASSPAAPATP